MVFNDCESIEIDIKDKITSYMYDYKGIKDLISLLRSYLYELKIKKELSTYDVIKINKERFNISFTKGDKLYEFGVSMDLELRNLKIKKIISNKILDMVIF